MLSKLLAGTKRTRAAAPPPSVPLPQAEDEPRRPSREEELLDAWPEGKAPPEVRWRARHALQSLLLMFAGAVAVAWIDGSARSAFLTGAFFLLFIGFVVAVGWVSSKIGKIHRDLGPIVGAGVILAAFAALAVWFVSNWGR